MKTKFGISQFFANNTPKVIQVIGDIALTCASISAFILGIPVAVPSVVLPPQLITFATVVATIGAVSKFATKFFGNVDTNGTPVITPPPTK